MSIRRRREQFRFQKAAQKPQRQYEKRMREERRQRQAVAVSSEPAGPSGGRYSARASLCAVGTWVQRMGLLTPLHVRVKIPQKKVKYRPVDKLVDCVIGVLCNIAGVYGVNTTVRADPYLSICFGRTGCAEASTIQDTLDHCTEENVDQLREVLNGHLTKYGGCTHHNFASLLVLDIDLQGQRSGRQAEGATKGYFPGARDCRGRQLVRVYASNYDEIVCQWQEPGNTNSSEVLKAAITRAESILQLTAEQRKHTLIRADGGFGTDANINWLLWRGYQVLIKGYSSSRAGKLAQSVEQWEKLAQDTRELGEPGSPHRYGRRTKQMVIKSLNRKGKVYYRVLVTSLLEMPWRKLVKLYDARGGHPESSFQQDGEGLKLTKRQKKRWWAQQMVVGLGQLAHNLLVWAKRRMQEAEQAARLASWGLQRWVRDVLNIPGLVVVCEEGVSIRLSALNPLTRHFIQGFGPLLEGSGLCLSSGEI